MSSVKVLYIQSGCRFKVGSFWGIFNKDQKLTTATGLYKKATIYILNSDDMGYKDIDIIFKLENFSDSKPSVDGLHPACLRYDESVTCKTLQNCDKMPRKKNSRARKFSKNRDDDLRWSVVRVRMNSLSYLDNFII